MHTLLKKVHAYARKNPRRIVFPEGEEIRVLKAIEKIQKRNFAKPIILGNKPKIQSLAKKLHLKINWKSLTLIDPKTSPLAKKYGKILFDLRKKKGLSRPAALKLIKDHNFFGTMMVYVDDADGMVTGSNTTTADSIRPALEIIKTKEQYHKVSGVFFMILGNRPILFADCAVNIEPSPDDLADIAIDTARTAKRFGIKPRIALLSFSTKGSSENFHAKKIRRAVEFIKMRNPKLIVDGELQVDAALVPKVAKLKCPQSPIRGRANVLIFPNLESANIAYKLVQRLAKAHAIGPILQGLKKPVNDLSRGCSVDDIVNLTAFTVFNYDKNPY